MRRLPHHAIQTSQNMRREGCLSIRQWVRAAAAAVLLGGSPAAAQDYPNKPVRIVVGFAAGSASDLVARALALGDGSQERRDPQPDRRAHVQGDTSSPNSFLRPSWSPDGQWLAFSSDRNTDWGGHDGGKSWEHTQELSIYVIRADGRDFRRIASRPGYCLGSPKWSPDGRRVAFYEMTTEDTWGARRPNLVANSLHRSSRLV